MSRRGFSLIELLVVVGVLGSIMIVSTVILSNTLKSKNRMTVSDTLEINGSQVIRNLRQLVLEAKTVGMGCEYSPSGVGTSIALINRFDDGITTLRCYENDRIASESANGNFDLTMENALVVGCNNFVRCDTLPSSPITRVSAVHFNFNLKIGSTATPETGVSRNFKVEVGPRN